MTSHREFPCRVDRIVDGDTLLVTIDCGFRINVQSMVRLAGVDCPELSTLEGVVARNFVMNWVIDRPPLHTWPFVLVCHGYDRRDKYGRWLGDLITSDGASLVASLIAAGHVKAPLL